MFDKSDFDINFYILKNYNKYDYVFTSYDDYHYYSIIKSLINKNLLKEAFNYTREELSVSTLYENNKSNFKSIKDRIINQSKYFIKTIEALSDKNTEFKIEYNLLILYFQGLIYHLVYSNPKVNYVPLEWIEEYEDEVISSKKAKSKNPIYYKACRLNINPTKTLNFKPYLYNLYSFINILYNSKFTKNYKVQNYRMKLHEAPNFRFNSTKNFIKSNSLIPNSYKKEIRQFCSILLNDNEIRLIDKDPSFNPTHTISIHMLNYIVNILKKFTVINEKEINDIVQISFHTNTNGIDYYQKELGYFALQLEASVNII